MKIKVKGVNYFSNEADLGPIGDSGIVSGRPIDYGNGVFFFPCVGRIFAIALSDFLKDGKKKVVSMTADGSAGCGADRGFFVFIKEKKEKKV